MGAEDRVALLSSELVTNFDFEVTDSCVRLRLEMAKDAAVEPAAEASG